MLADAGPVAKSNFATSPRSTVETVRGLSTNSTTENTRTWHRSRRCVPPQGRGEPPSARCAHRGAFPGGGGESGPSRTPAPTERRGGCDAGKMSAKPLGSPRRKAGESCPEGTERGTTPGQAAPLRRFAAPLPDAGRGKQHAREGGFCRGRRPRRPGGTALHPFNNVGRIRTKLRIRPALFFVYHLPRRDAEGGVPYTSTPGPVCHPSKRQRAEGSFPSPRARGLFQRTRPRLIVGAGALDSPARNACHPRPSPAHPHQAPSVMASRSAAESKDLAHGFPCPFPTWKILRLRRRRLRSG